jgi:hypothetical protein
MDICKSQNTTQSVKYKPINHILTNQILQTSRKGSHSASVKKKQKEKKKKKKK